jgi:hypothetical protein
MANKSNEETELLRALLITQLGLAGVPQSMIRTIAKCDINRVNSIVKHLNPKKSTKNQGASDATQKKSTRK